MPVRPPSGAFIPHLSSGSEAHDGRLLLTVRHGANVNYETRSGLTALIVGSAKGQTKAVAALVERGATIDYENRAGQTALIVASEKGVVRAGNERQRG
eukprot:3738964-Pyramimonas_sp.AAC.1